VSSAPSYLWILVLAQIAAPLYLTARVLHTTALETGSSPREAARAVAILTVGWGVWTVGSALLAASDVYRLGPNAAQPWIGVAFVVPLVALLVASRSQIAQRALSHPQIVARMASPHWSRLGGVIFLIAYLLGELPALFAIPAGVGDMAIGIASIWTLTRSGAHSQVRHLWLNVLGLVDFAYALTMGFLAGPGDLQVVHLTPSTQQISELPLVLIPTAGVPLLFALHLLSLVKLRARRRASVLTA
jgi:hypothetical protein